MVYQNYQIISTKINRPPKTHQRDVEGPKIGIYVKSKNYYYLLIYKILFFLLIEIHLPNEQGRLDILKIHSSHIAKRGDIGKKHTDFYHVTFFLNNVILRTIFFYYFQTYLDYEAVVKLSDGFNGADLRNVCTEAGMFAIRAERDYVIDEDFMKAVRKVVESKKLESKLDYKPI